MLQRWALRPLCLSSVRQQLVFVQNSRTFSFKRDGSDSKDAESFDAARKWFASFSESTIPTNISKTAFSKSQGPGGQKTNKTDSKATTVWPVDSLKRYLPTILQPKLSSSRYYVSSKNAISIQSDVHRSQSENKEETYRRFNEEISQIYKSTVPGVTSVEQSRKVEQLKKAENAARLKMKKMHGEKKRARKGGAGGDL